MEVAHMAQETRNRGDDVVILGWLHSRRLNHRQFSGTSGIQETVYNLLKVGLSKETSVRYVRHSEYPSRLSRHPSTLYISLARL
jgi:hypothetical protein